MARASTTSDAFNAIAEPRRRQILSTLSQRGDLDVSALVDALALSQPAVSKHLAVLRQVGLVAITRRGRQRVYSLRAQELKAVHAWIAMFERHWDHTLDRIAQRAEAQARQSGV